MKFPMITIAALALSQHVPTVTSVSVLPVNGHAEVVVGVEAAPIEVQDFTLDSPRRVVLDLKGITMDGAGPVYDKINRGGITNVRVSQYRTTTVRVVIELDGVHPYEVKHAGKEVRVVISGGSPDFAAWRGTVTAAGNNDVQPVPDNDATRTRPNVSPSIQQSTQSKINVSYQDADIREVIAAFAEFSGRTIVTGKDVSGTVTAEVHNQPWDVALRAILQGQGLAATEDPASGIITVDSYGNIQAKQALEPLITQLIPINYANADSLVPVITKLLAKDCASNIASSGSSQGGTNGQGNCYTRGAVVSNSATNTILVTETPSRIGDIINYVQNLDIRTPQVVIKAKIIFVDRTDIENLGLSYDLGTRNQFFSQLVKRTDPSTLKPVDTNGDGINDALGGGTAFTADQILLGGNTLSAIANANNRVTSPALSLVYSAALGKYSLTSFLDALQEIRLADLQAEPSITTLDNKQAQIQVGQDVPVRVLDASATNSGGATGNNVPRATVSFRPVGIILNVTPHITNNRQILLTVHAENSDAQIASSDVGYVFNKQSADNRLLVGDGETAVIGGLTVTQVSQNKSGIPLLIDLPMIGKLFGTTNKSEEKRDLLILITPHIIDAGERVGNRGQP